MLHHAANLSTNVTLKLSKNNVSMPVMAEQDLLLPLKTKLYTAKKLLLMDPVSDSIHTLVTTVKLIP